MDSHSVRAHSAPRAVRIAGVDFDNVEYDSRGDVLYLHVGRPESAVEFDGTVEGDGARFGPDGSLVGLTILNARARFQEQGGKIELTLPEHRIVAGDLADLLIAV